MRNEIDFWCHMNFKEIRRRNIRKTKQIEKQMEELSMM